MTFKTWYWLGTIWAFLAILGGILDQTPFVQADKDVLNQAANVSSVGHIDDAVLSDNPINVEIGFLGLGALDKIMAVVKAATFQNDFWSGDMVMVRWLMYATIGGALGLQAMWHMAPAVLGAIRGLLRLPGVG